MATNENIRVVQLTDDNDNPVSPVVNVGSLYDKNGNKVDNLVSYKVAGTNVPVPEIKNVEAELTAKVDSAILDMKTQVEAFTMNGGLPVNDVRSAVVADGQNINAGDVVDVVDGKASTNYAVVNENAVDYTYNIGNQSTKIKVVDSPMASLKISDSTACVMANFGEYVGTNVYIVNSDGSEYASFATGEIGGSFSAAKYTVGTDTLVMFIVSNGISGVSNDLNTRYILVPSSGVASINGSTSSSSRKALDGKYDFILASFENRNDGVLCVINTDVYRYYKNPTSTSELTYEKLGTLKNIPTNINNYSICSLGNIISGTEGFLLSYYNITDKKTYLVVFTVNNSSNAIVVGTPIVTSTVADADTFLRKLPNGNIVYIIKESNSNSYIFNVTVTNRTVAVKNKSSILSGTTVTNLIDIGALSDTKLVAMYSNSDSGMYVKTFMYSGPMVTENAPHIVNGTAATDLVKTSGAILPFDEKFVAVTSYTTNTYNKLHGAALENREDLYGDHIVTSSTQAIALESGSSGDTISLGYGGYCRMTTVKSGESIRSNGVCGACPIDGWLDVTPKYKRQSIVTGTYTGNGSSMTINLGFKPSLVISGSCTSGFDNSGFVFGGLTTEVHSTSGGIINLSSNGFTVSGNACSNGGVYTYAAWR